MYKPQLLLSCRRVWYLNTASIAQNPPSCSYRRQKPPQIQAKEELLCRIKFKLELVKQHLGNQQQHQHGGFKDERYLA
jgi:hypothetical protein